jgi:hypothetical protein
MVVLKVVEWVIVGLGLILFLTFATYPVERIGTKVIKWFQRRAKK